MANVRATLTKDEYRTYETLAEELNIDKTKLFGHLLRKYNEMKTSDLGSVLESDTRKLLAEAGELSHYTQADIINAGIQHRAKYAITAAKNIDKQDVTEIERNEKGNIVKTYAGVAYERIDNFVNAIMAHNEAQTDSSKRIAITQTAIMNSTKDAYRKSNFEAVGFTENGIASNRPALKKYLEAKKETIIKHNVKMGVFEETVKYVSNKTGKRDAMIEIARKYGYKG